MDRLIYTAMTGASHLLQQQATVAQNLANTNTPGFRAAISTFRAVPLVGEGLPTRTFVVASASASDFSQGAFQPTGRDLDVAVQGDGWIALQMPDGSEAYTRNGNLEISSNGILQTRSGLPVAGDGGPITIPPTDQVSIAKDGTISVVPTGSKASQIVTVGSLKLVNPPSSQMVRGDDGLFRTRDGSPAAADTNVSVAAGNLESSNVNTISAMVDMIALARSYDMQMKMLTTADNNAKTAETVLNINA